VGGGVEVALDLETAEVASPVGTWALAVGPLGLCRLTAGEDWDAISLTLARRFGNPVHLREVVDPGGAVSALHAYFAGDLRALDALAVDPGGTEFQRQVWAELRRIAPGRTTSYGKLATAIGRPAAMRAVGAANGANPVAVVIPCHRVIGKNGALTGYGGGLPRKAWLLRHEGALF
jgi:methylated-DNA-[protein]-cysteine S-methyltransferase